jgi:hypothetical protein
MLAALAMVPGLAFSLPALSVMDQGDETVTDEKVMREAARRNPGWFRRLTSALRPLPDFMVVGAQKSGTTSLYSYIVRHPAVRTARLKELHYFDREFAHGSAWYRSQFPLGLGTRSWRTGEATPYYLAHPLVPARAARLVPNARIIVLLRNPIDRAYSHYQHSANRGQEHRTFEEALEVEAELIRPEEARIASNPGYRSIDHERRSYLTRGLYAEQLERWFEHFPPEQVLVLLSEALFQSPEAEVSKVFAFMGLSSLPAAHEMFEQQKAGIYQNGLAPATRSRLIEYFRPHNRRLAELLGVSLDWDR